MTLELDRNDSIIYNINLKVEELQDNIQFQLTDELIEKVEVLVEDQQDSNLKTLRKLFPFSITM